MLKLGQKVSKNYTVSEVINTPERIKEIFSNNNPNEKVGIVTKKGNLRLIGEAFLFNKICGKDPIQAEKVREKWIQTFIDRGCFMAVKDVVTKEDKGVWSGASVTTIQEISKIDGKPVAEPIIIDNNVQEPLVVTLHPKPIQPEEEIIIEEPITGNPTEYETIKENIYDKKISIEAWALALNLILVVIGVISFYFMASLPLWYWGVLVSISVLMNVILIVIYQNRK